MGRTEGQNNKLPIGRLVIVSNRLPITLNELDIDQWQVQLSSGGLVTALTPIIKERGGIWIGWPGVLGEDSLDNTLAKASRDLGYDIKAVSLTKEEIDGYYLGFANEIIWPLFHDLPTRCNFDPRYWNACQTVNHKFAQVVAENVRGEDFIWIHDYHLMLVAKELRDLNITNKIGFFLHTPFPPLDILVKLPWRRQLLSALFDYDIVGFQTRRDRNNYIHCIENMFDGIRIDARRHISTVKTLNREISIGSFPISIDFKDFARQAASPAISQGANQLRQAIPNQQIILGVDRLDYSKGIPEKLKGFSNLLERFEELHGKITLIQIAVPSREDIPEYQSLRSEIEGLVGRINGRFSRSGWIPVQYMFRTFERTELLGYYRAADIALITSLKDGMNLVAKEYCAANIDNDGILILSEFTGAAAQLQRYSLIVNPYDIEGIAEAIHRACDMSTEERRWRMRRLRELVARSDVFQWVDSFLQAAVTSE